MLTELRENKSPTTGEFGILEAQLRRKVLFHFPNIALPGLPPDLTGGYHYEGNSLTIIMTFVEPRYTVTIEPPSLAIPQGCEGETTVNVEPLEEGITGHVNFGFEWQYLWENEWQWHSDEGIHGWVDTSSIPPGTPVEPPLSLPLKVYIEPWVEPMEYRVRVVVHDTTGGNAFYSDPVSMTVLESGYIVEVNGGTEDVVLPDLSIGSGDNGFPVIVTPTTCYTDWVWLGCEPGGEHDIGFWIEPENEVPYLEAELVVNVGPTANPGTYEFDVVVRDDNLGRDFRCHVTVTVPP